MSFMSSDVSQLPSGVLDHVNGGFGISNIGTENRACSLCTTVEDHLRHILPQIPRMPAVQGRGESDRVYKVEIYTGHEVDCGTNANVYITVQGSEGVLSRTKLSHAKTSAIFYFMRATKEVFFLKGPNVGNLETVIIEHDGLEERQSWFLDKIDITDSLTEHCWTFPCGQWLSRYMKDHSSKKRLVGRTVENLSGPGQDLPETDYTLAVTLGRKTPGSIGASYVVMTLFGTEGHSKAIDLTNDALWETKKFDGGQTITMSANMDNIGELTKVRIEHDSAESTQGWFLVRVVVKCTNSKKYFFQYSGWIGKDTKGKVIRDIKCCKVLPNQVTQEKSDWRFCYLCANMEEHKRNHLHWRSKRPFTAKPRIEYKPNKLKARQGEEEETGKPKVTENMYKLDVCTGSETNAGTKANVYVTLLGQQGMIHRTKLQKTPGSTTFQTNSIQTFLVKGPYLGNLIMLSIEHDGEERRDSWFLEKVILTDTHTNRAWSFPCHQWLSLYKQDGRLQRDLVGREMSNRVSGSNHSRNGKELHRNTDVNHRITSSPAKIQQTPARPRTSVDRQFLTDRNESLVGHTQSVSNQEIESSTEPTERHQESGAAPPVDVIINRQQMAKPPQPLRQQLEEPVQKTASLDTGVNSKNYSFLNQQNSMFHKSQNDQLNKAVPTYTSKPIIPTANSRHGDLWTRDNKGVTSTFTTRPSLLSFAETE